MEDPLDPQWPLYSVIGTIWLCLGLICYIPVLILVQRYRWPGSRRIPSFWYSYAIILSGPIFLILLIHERCRSRRSTHRPTPSEFWAQEKTNRTRSDDEPKE